MSTQLPAKSSADRITIARTITTILIWSGATVTVVSGKLRGKEVAFVTIPAAISTFVVWFPWPWVKAE